LDTIEDERVFDLSNFEGGLIGGKRVMNDVDVDIGVGVGVVLVC
jgi:hypothetical protein